NSAQALADWAEPGRSDTVQISANYSCPRASRVSEDDFVAALRNQPLWIAARASHSFEQARKPLACDRGEVHVATLLGDSSCEQDPSLLRLSPQLFSSQERLRPKRPSKSLRAKARTIPLPRTR